MSVQFVSYPVDIKVACDAVSTAILLMTEIKHTTIRLKKLDKIQEINKFPQELYEHIRDIIICHDRELR